MAVRVPVRYSWNWLWAVVMVLGERLVVDARGVEGGFGKGGLRFVSCHSGGADEEGAELPG